MNEDQFRREVTQIAQDWGWTVAHAGRARAGRRWITPIATGFPDLVLLRPPQLVFIELKTTRGVRSPEQVKWIGDLQQCTGVEAYFADPDDAEELWHLLAQLH